MTNSFSLPSFYDLYDIPFLLVSTYYLFISVTVCPTDIRATAQALISVCHNRMSYLGRAVDLFTVFGL